MTLTSVENDKVTLAQGGDEEVLTLQVQKGPAVAATAPGVPMAGPFGPAGGTGVPGQPVPGMPTPAQSGGVQPPGTPVPAQPQIAAQPAAPAAANPAQRSGFGPFQAPPATGANTSEATPMTPEELLARRRARRGQQ